MNTRRYLTGGAFKNALEQRLRKASKHGDDFSRRRQLLVFHRFLARAAQAFGDAVTLKGGLVLELRLEQARTTRDVDLRLTGSPRDLLSRLQQAGQLDLGDFMRFELRLDTHHPEIQTEGLRYDGQRFRARISPPAACPSPASRAHPSPSGTPPPPAPPSPSR
ncbi:MULTISPECIES: nucleotidyl transferase AbiEii/AbiGii toxin family protein [Myxococcus]|uniref:nucleotidyl transferase AbiEii/AbiGii toxin family protein n=1 Tax=Myxococcus TaxID=32 RepID=UPI0013D58F61|nr:MULTISPECIES: nucleotidyl transferase AbiEii/AbiGii toxin family protein [Myxococcus]NVJ27406.1 nucleotidyl transferase AbiEii/AbiGii toxin family protein [Myxococcus sp. AM011]